VRIFILLVWTFFLHDTVVSLPCHRVIGWCVPDTPSHGVDPSTHVTLEEYPVKIHARSKLHYFPLIKDRLNEGRRLLFCTTCFRPWLDITYVENDDGMIHYVLQTQCCADDDSFDLPLIYNVNGHNLHFRWCEFCLVTGFKFGMVSFREYRNGDIPFRNWLFLKKIRNDVKIINVLAIIEDEEKFSKVSDEDAIRLYFLLSLEVIFMGQELVLVVDDVLLRMVDNLDAWNTFSWGKKPNHVPSYSLSGFLFAFKIWIIESSYELDGWLTKVPELIPRAVAWMRKAEFFKLGYFGDLFHKVITLKTNCVEKEETSEDESDIRDNTSKIIEKAVLMPANPIPQVFLVDYYFKNLCCVDSDEEVTLMYRSHEKAKKDVSTMSLEELIVWEKKETQSPSYLRSPHVWKKTSSSTSKGKVLLDDSEDVANGKGKVLFDDFEAVGNGKGKVVLDESNDGLV
nr:phospholipase-like, aminotransferase-like mobile domain protein [Tanacetum cinerariifolium]